VVFGMTKAITQNPPEMSTVPDEANADASHSRLHLVRRIGNATWLAESDGDMVVAQATSATQPDPSVLEQPGRLSALADLFALRGSQLVPLLELANRDDGSSWLLSEHVAGVSLHRLLGIVTFTPAQAAYVALSILEGLTQLHNAGYGHGRLDAANVWLGTNGEPRLGNWALSTLSGGRTFDEVRAADLDGARLLVGELARNANRPVVWRRHRDDALQGRLEHFGNGGSTAGIPAMTRGLQAALHAAMRDDTGIAEIRRELAALVRALGERVAADHPSGEARDGIGLRESNAPRASWRNPTRVPSALTARALSPARWRQPHRRRWIRVVATTVVLLVVAAAGYAVARKPIASFADRVLHPHSSTTKPGGPASVSNGPTHGNSPSGKPAQTRPGPTPRPVVALAPSKAGAISAVDLRPLASCSARAACPVRLTVRFDPAYSGEAVRWHLAVVNRCTGSTKVLARGTVTGLPGTYVFDSTSAVLPAATSMAVIAVTDAPARAASPPLLVPSGGGRC